MMNWVKNVFAASLLSSLAMTLCPAGRVRSVTRMVCGIVCALAMVSPILTIDLTQVSVGLEAYREQARILQENGEEEGKMQERTYIEEQCAAYILGKAEENALEIDGATIEARWDDEALLWYPWSAELDGFFDVTLSALIEGELGIPAMRQYWRQDD